MKDTAKAEWQAERGRIDAEKQTEKETNEKEKEDKKAAKEAKQHKKSDEGTAQLATRGVDTEERAQSSVTSTSG